MNTQLRITIQDQDSEAPAELEAVVFVVSREFDIPPMIWPGENVAADDADAGPGDHVVRMMGSGFDAAVGDERGERVCRDAIFPSIAFAHEFRGREGNGGVA